MPKLSLVAIPVALAFATSCSSSTASTPAPAGTPAPATVAGTPGGGGRAGAQVGAAAAPAGGRGGALTVEQRAARRDSIAAARSATVAELMATITGRENEPAGTVFKNVQLMKNVPAGQFLAAMDQGIGRGLGRGCNDCHVTTAWDSDTIPRKKTARTMMGIVNDINTTLLPKMGPGRGGAPRAIQCVTCHRGGAAGSTAIVP